MIVRQNYLDSVIPLIDKKLIKVITGVRRSGKTVLLSQIRDYIANSGVDESRLIYINFESIQYEYLLSYDALYKHIVEKSKSANGRVYVFLDEIQSVPMWEKALASLLVDLDCDIFVTGSNSKLLSGELATLIAGRYIQIRIYPFTLSEAKEISMQNGTYTTDENLFADYLQYGGLPMRFSLVSESQDAYLSDTYDAIVLKDIIRRNNLSDNSLLKLILDFLMDNISNTFSARSVVAALAQNGIKTTANTVINYIDYIKAAMIMYAAPRYDIKGKRILMSGEKYYATDLGLRNIRKASNRIDYNKLYENIIYLELLSRGYDVKVGKTDSYEIDFVAEKSQKTVYVQVCYLLASPETEQREFGNLQRISDNFPKYVISGDIPDFSRNGVTHCNIIDFLLNKRNIGL